MNREELLKSAKPILFSTPMVQAILEGRKTVTRRVIKGLGNNLWIDKPLGDWTLSEKPYIKNGLLYWELQTDVDNSRVFKIKLPYKARDILYVRETFYYENHMHDLTAGEPDLPNGEYSHRYIYKASNPEYPVHKWKPSLFMPKVAARLFLKVTDVRVERLQDITEKQAIKEGELGLKYDSKTGKELSAVLDWFPITWNSTIKKQDLDKYGWEANPWVWVVEFEMMEVENE